MTKKFLEYDDLIGAIRYKGVWRIFANYIYEWILDYSTYNPTYCVPGSLDPDGYLFRNGILVVDVNNAEQYIRGISEFELSIEDIKNIIKNKGEDAPLSVVIDFDNQVYINGYFDIAMEKFTPRGWTYYYDNPLKYVPKHIADLWVGL